MRIRTNHIWCPLSHWNNGNFKGRAIVTIDENEDREWLDLIKKIEFFDEVEFNYTKKYNEKHGLPAPDKNDTVFTRETVTLKPIAMHWLNKNIPNIEGTKAWCIGNNEFNKRNYGEFDIFFKRLEDGLAFIEKFSQYKQPTEFFDYFNDSRKFLDKKTNQLREKNYG